MCWFAAHLIVFFGYLSLIQQVNHFLWTVAQDVFFFSIFEVFEVELLNLTPT